MSAIGDLVATMSMNTKPFAAGAQRSKGILRRMETATVSSVGRMKAAFAGLAGIAGTLGVGLGIGALVIGAKKAVAAVTVQEQAEKKLQAVLQATGHAAGFSAAELQQYASELQGVTNYGDEATISAMGMLATFKNIKGDMFKEATAAMQDMSAVMGTDMKSSVVQIGKALNDPIKGMASLSRVGVTFSESQIKQVKTLQKQGDLLGAQRIIMTELQSQFGGAAAKMADPLTQVGNAIGDIWEKVGGFIKPVFVTIAQGFLSAIDYVSSFSKHFSAVGSAIWSYWTAIWTGLSGTVAAVFAHMGFSAGGFGDSIRSVLEFVANYFNTLAFVARNFTNIAKLAVNNFVLYVLESFPLMEGPITNLGATFISVWSGVKAFFGSIVENVIGGLKEIKNFGLAVGSAITALWESMTSGDFAGAASAAADAFINTLASQKDVIAPNAFGEFKRAYDEAGAEYREKVKQSGGMGGFIRDQQKQIKKDIAANEVANTELQRRKQAQGEGADLALAGMPSMKASSEKKKENKVLLNNSNEAWKKIVGSMYGKKDKAADRTAKATEKMAGSLDRIENKDTTEESIP
jgi:hypothetical protein